MLIITLPPHSCAEWKVISPIGDNSETKTDVTYTQNDAGYSIKLCRDSVNAIRSRFSITNSLLRFTNKSCPTYQVDRGMSQNRSTNDAPCISSPSWSEFILGQIDGNSVKSSTLLALMNGISITFYFRLSNGDYRETKFSLYGSKRAMITIFDEELAIDAS